MVCWCRGLYISLRLDGRVRASGAGAPPWQKIAAQLPPMSGKQLSLPIHLIALFQRWKTMAAAFADDHMTHSNASTLRMRLKRGESPRAAQCISLFGTWLRFAVPTLELQVLVGRQGFVHVLSAGEGAWTGFFDVFDGKM